MTTPNPKQHTMTLAAQDEYGHPTPEAVATLLSKVANVHAEDFAKIAELVRRDHRTLQQGIAGFAIQLIAAFAQNADDGLVDARNEFSTDLCVKLRDTLKEAGMVKPDGTLYRMPLV